MTSPMTARHMGFTESWRDTTMEDIASERHGAGGGLQFGIGDEILVIKRPAYAARRAVPDFSSRSANWARMFSPQHLARPANRDDPNHDAIETRVARLRSLSADSGDMFDEASAEHLLRFCHDLAADVRPAIFLLLNGNLRAVWENDAQEQIGLQFLPDGLMKFVMFRLDADALLETMGTERDVAAIEKWVADLRLRRLWFHGKG